MGLRISTSMIQSMAAKTLEDQQGELARISAAADDEVLRCPECGAILLRVKDGG